MDLLCDEVECYKIVFLLCLYRYLNNINKDIREILKIVSHLQIEIKLSEKNISSNKIGLEIQNTYLN